MSASRRPVKRTRGYDTTTRQDRARRLHDKALDVAAEAFLADGYEATTVAAIAASAGVSAATIYKSYGGKAGLVRDLCHRALRGQGAVPAEERSNALRASGSVDDLVDGWGSLTIEVAPRVAPLLLLLRDAATADPDAARLLDELDRDRLARMTSNARFLDDARYLRDGVSVEEARDVLWLSTSPELYELLVQRRRWPLPRFADFVTRTIRTITR
jgi:AcrR family transcriptional regulator